MDREALHVPEAYIEVEVRDKDGNIIHYHRQKARTWVKNFFIILRYGNANSVPQAQRQDGTVTSTNTTFTDMFKVTSPTGDSNYGILVGMGTKAWAIDDYKLDNKITHGSSSNQLLYGNTTVEDLIMESNRIYYRIIRTFTNSSGSTITVTEVGLAMSLYNNYVIIARDLLNPPATVPNGSTLTVRYIIQMTW